MVYVDIIVKEYFCSAQFAFGSLIHYLYPILLIYDANCGPTHPHANERHLLGCDFFYGDARPFNTENKQKSKEKKKLK